SARAPSWWLTDGTATSSAVRASRSVTGREATAGPGPTTRAPAPAPAPAAAPPGTVAARERHDTLPLGRVGRRPGHAGTRRPRPGHLVPLAHAGRVGRGRPDRGDPRRRRPRHRPPRARGRRRRPRRRRPRRLR